MNARSKAATICVTVALATFVTAQGASATPHQSGSPSAGASNHRASPFYRAPAQPTALHVPNLAFDDTSVSLVWEKPTDNAGIVDYDVYENGHKIGSANDNAASASQSYINSFYADPSNAQQVKVAMTNFDVTGLKPSTSYRFTVRAVDADGHESRDSNVVVQRTTKTPKIFDVTSYGAVGDGTSDNTQAIQKAIDAATPGATVLIPAGTFVSGALWLKSDMTFKVGEGGTLLGSADASLYPYHFRLYDYSTDERFFSLLNAQSFTGKTMHDIRIVGPGAIDGNGWQTDGIGDDGFPQFKKGTDKTVATLGVLAATQTALAGELGNSKPYPTRSNLVMLHGVKNVYYGNFTAMNPANHTLVNVKTSNVTVNGLRILTHDANNADGIEFTQSSGLDVYNTVFDTGDDDMNFAAGLGQESADGPSTGNARIFDNYFAHGHGAVVAGSHTGGWVENITAEDNVINGTEIGLRMKTVPTNGGGARNVVFKDNAMKNIVNQAFIFTSAYSDPNAAVVVAPAKKTAYFHDIHVQNVTVDGVGKSSINVIGVDAQPHTDIDFADVTFLHGTKTDISGLTNSTFHNVVFDDVAAPWVVSDSSGLKFTGTTTTDAISDDAASAPVWPHWSFATVKPALTTAQVSWPTATDNTSVAQYEVTVDGGAAQVVPAGTTSTELTGLAPRSLHSVKVVALDATGARSTALDRVFLTTGSRDRTAPTVPSDAAVTTQSTDGAVGSTWVGIQWTPATDDVAVTSYVVKVNGRTALTVPGDQTSATVVGLKPDADQVIGVIAVDGSGNTTTYPGTLTAHTTRSPALPTDPRLG